MPKKKKGHKNIDKALRIEKKVRKAIIHFLLSGPEQSFNHKQVAAGAKVKGQVSHNKVIEILDELCQEGKANKVGRGKYTIVIMEKVFDGRIEIIKDGNGFFVPDKEGMDDVFIPQRHTLQSFHGDRVRIKISRTGRPGRRSEGKVLEILERARTSFIGTISVERGMAFFHSAGKNQQEFSVPEDQLLAAKHGDKVLLEFLHWDHHLPEGKVTRVLGPTGDNETEMHAILFQFGFIPEFPEQVEAEADQFQDKISPAEIAKRRDMRKTLTFTIDPHDAKDFDDAISFRKLDNGHYEIGVHIADVSHFVRPGTELDQEAYDRATSVYLVDRTVPMLPEKLSNNLCSLKPHVDRLAFSAIFEIDEDAKLHGEWFGQSVIHSDRRFSYEQAQEVIESGEGDHPEELRICNELAKKMQRKRYKEGSISFEEDEVRFELDENSKPVRVYRKVRKDAHKMIEDWMLLANRRVSEFVYRLRKQTPLPFVYRIHDRPDPEKLHKLRAFVANLGYDLDLENPSQVSKALNGLMMDVTGKPEQSMVQTVAVRTMSKAVYSTENIGHYGLGFDYYSHFTSPIRRYPDLLVHRLLAKYLSKDFSGNPVKLEEACKHCSGREKRATDAERASIKFKQVEFLEDQVGKQYEGMVSGVTKWGLYVEIIENKCEGMVGLRSLEDDFYEVDEQNYRVLGARSGKSINLGDKVLIEVSGTNMSTRNIDFDFIKVLEPAVKSELLETPAKSKPNMRGNSKKKSGSNHRSGKRRSKKQYTKRR